MVSNFQVSALRFPALTALTLTICYFAQPVLITLCISVLFAFILAPVAETLQRLRLSAGLAAFLAVVLASLLMYGITYYSYNSAMSLWQDVPRLTRKIRQPLLGIQQHAQTLESALPKMKEDKDAVKVIPQINWSDILVRNVGSVTEFAFLVSFIPFLVYFMLSRQHHLLTATVLLFRPENQTRVRATLQLVSAMIRSFVAGSLVVGLFMAAVSIIMFALLQIPYFYFAGFVSGFLSLIPYLGVILAVIPPLIAGAEQISGPQILFIVFAQLGLHVFVTNLLFPKLLANRLQLNPLIVTVSLLFWGWFWGAMGLILAVPITATVKIIFDHVDSLRPYGAWMGGWVEKKRGLSQLAESLALHKIKPQP